MKTAYAAALMLAAASGSILAFAGSAFAQNKAGTADTAAPVSAPVQSSPVTLSSKAMIERSEAGQDGVQKLVLKDPSEVIVVPGDRVVFTLSYENNGSEAATGFRATNPMPGPIQFISAGEDWAEMSVDGGATWGRLEQLKITEEVKAAEEGSEGQEQSAPAQPVTRAADAKDVTHVRWVFADPIPAGAKGSISFRGVVK